MSKTIGKYFVGCGPANADRLYFSWDEAKSEGHDYIAVFDGDGEKVSEWKLDEDGIYTSDF